VCFGLELDPIYVDLIIRRWQAWSGGNAIHATTGERFDDRAAAVSASISAETDEEANDGD
jgi:DNA modification methylase